MEPTKKLSAARTFRPRGKHRYRRVYSTPIGTPGPRMPRYFAISLLFWGKGAPAQSYRRVYSTPITSK